MKPDITSTMQQMLQALMGQQGPQGKGPGGSGQGGGGGGAGQDGYSVAGQSSVLPAYGPDRLQFSDSEQTSTSGSSKGDGKNNSSPEEQANNKVSPDQHRKTENALLAPESIPTRYRDAVKKYFSQPEPTQN